MSEPPNSVRVFLNLDLRLLINQDCAKTDQLPATFILKLLTEHYKNRLPKEVYDALIEEYSMTALEQRERKRLKKQEKERKEDRETLKLREEISLCEIRLREKNLANPDYWKDRLAQAKEKLEIHLSAKTEPQSGLLESHKSGRIPRKRKRA